MIASAIACANGARPRRSSFSDLIGRSDDSKKEKLRRLSGGVVEIVHSQRDDPLQAKGAQLGV